jgi:elongation factor P
MLISATQLRVGMVIMHENHLYRVTSVYHHTPGNLRGQVHIKGKRLKDDVSLENRFRSEDQVERVSLDQKDMQYLYSQDNQHYFMDTETFDQMHLTEEMLGDSAKFLMPNMVVKVDFYENNPIGIELPKTVDLKVVSTEAQMKGATASASYKPATVESGFTVLVPPFVKEGDIIRVDTETGKYLERVNK